jgi:hypothetical protein
MAEVTTAERLSRYGLEDRAGTLGNLTLQPGRTQRLTRDDPNMREHAVVLEPKTPDELKAWLGVAADAPRPAATKRVEKREGRAAAQTPMHLRDVRAVAFPRPTEFDADEQASMYRLARDYVLNPTAETNPLFEGALSQWIGHMGVNIGAYFLYDIYVSAGSTLTLGADIILLFANHVTVEDTGQILTESGHVKFDIAGFQSAAPSSGGTGTGTTGTTGTT